MHMASIIPAIIPHDLYDVKDHVRKVVSGVDTVHLDICDGSFTKKPTWPYRAHDAFFDAIVEEEEGLPYWEEVDYDVHLMCNKPEEIVEQWMRAGAKRICIHAETTADMPQLLKMGNSFVEIVPALLLDTPLEVVDSYADSLKTVLLMTIEKIGGYGEPFSERALSKIEACKKRFPHISIMTDGGLNGETIQRAVGAGSDSCIVGSAIFTDVNPLAAVRELENLIQ